MPQEIDDSKEFKKISKQFYEDMTEFLLFKFQFLRDRKPDDILHFKTFKYQEINKLILHIIPNEELMMFLC